MAETVTEMRRKPDSASQLIAAIEVGIRILAGRVLSLIALGMAFGLFCWAMSLGTILSFIGAGAFGVIFLLVLFAERRTHGDP